MDSSNQLGISVMVHVDNSTGISVEERRAKDKSPYFVLSFEGEGYPSVDIFLKEISIINLHSALTDAMNNRDTSV